MSISRPTFKETRAVFNYNLSSKANAASNNIQVNEMQRKARIDKAMWTQSHVNKPTKQNAYIPRNIAIECKRNDFFYSRHPSIHVAHSTQIHSERKRAQDTTQQTTHYLPVATICLEWTRCVLRKFPPIDIWQHATATIGARYACLTKGADKGMTWLNPKRSPLSSRD